MVRIVAIVGPESTGKTTLAHDLAAHFGVAGVEEFARAYLAAVRGTTRPMSRPWRAARWHSKPRRSRGAGRR